MGAHLERARLLLGQGRYELAEQELRQAIVEEPEPAAAHALLALCCCERDRFDEATREAQTAIAREPNLAFAHYIYGHVLLCRHRTDEAYEAAREALRLDPESAAHHALVSQIRMEERRWTEALEAAERGLEVDSEDVACNNLRAAALVKLGRRAEAGATIESALARDPENAATHANQGWVLLHEGDPRKAMEHFREALRLEPGHEWARAGIVEALKARNVLYGVMLKYFLWMGRLSGRAQWMVILGAYFGNQLLRGLAKSTPALAPWILPISIAYALFALLSWIAYPLFNLFLRLHPFGKYALSAEQKRASNWIGSCIFLALACLAVGWGLNLGVALKGAIGFGVLLLPLSCVFSCTKGWPRGVMVGYTALLVAFLSGFAFFDSQHRLYPLFLNGFVWGTILSGFVGNALSQVTPRR